MVYGFLLLVLSLIVAGGRCCRPVPLLQLKEEAHEKYMIWLTRKQEGEKRAVQPYQMVTIANLAVVESAQAGSKLARYPHQVPQPCEEELQLLCLMRLCTCLLSRCTTRTTKGASSKHHRRAAQGSNKGESPVRMHQM